MVGRAVLVCGPPPWLGVCACVWPTSMVGRALLVRELPLWLGVTDSEFSCLAMLAKPYPVSGPTPLPQIPNQIHCVQKSAHEVLGTIFGT